MISYFLYERIFKDSDLLEGIIASFWLLLEWTSNYKIWLMWNNVHHIFLAYELKKSVTKSIHNIPSIFLGDQ